MGVRDALPARGLWVTSILIICAFFALHLPLPVDGVTGDLDSFQADGFHVQWVLEERPNGLLAGDVIQRVEGLRYDEWLSGRGDSAAWRRGAQLRYDITRDGQAMSLSIALQPLPLVALLRHWGVQFTAALGMIIVGSLILWQRPEDLAARWLMVFCTMTAVQAVGDAWNFQPALMGHRALFWLQFLSEHISYTLAFSAVVMEALAFPRPLHIVERHSSGLGAGLVSAALVGIFGVFWLAPSPWIYGLRWSNIASVGMAALYVVTGLVFFIRSYRQSGDLAERAQIRWFLYTAAVTSALAVPFYYFPIALGQPPLLPQPVGTALTLAIPVTLAMVILGYNLYEIDIIINRSLVYGGATVLLAALFGGGLLVIDRVTMALSGQPTPTVIIAILAGLCGMAFQPLRRTTQQIVDRRFYKIGIDYQQVVDRQKRLEQMIVNIPAHTQFGPYCDLEYVGRGASAQVYRAYHQETGLAVAIKLLPPLSGEDQVFRRRFEREARLIARLRHPNIIQLYDFGEVFGATFMVLEYIDGPSLEEYLQPASPMPLDQALPILRNIAGALDYAHEQGLVHRDVKPANIILDAGGGRPGNHRHLPDVHRAVLTDFGIARMEADDTRLTMEGVMGTFEYIAPEQIEAAASVDGLADVYSLGVVAYEMLTGRTPFKVGSIGAALIAHLMHPPPDPRERFPDFPDHAASALLRALAKRPEERFASATEFVRALVS